MVRQEKGFHIFAAVGRNTNHQYDECVSERIPTLVIESVEMFLRVSKHGDKRIAQRLFNLLSYSLFEIRSLEGIPEHSETG